MASKTDAKSVMNYFGKIAKARKGMYVDTYNNYLDEKKKGGSCMACSKKKK